MSDITEFLLARIDEDERHAQKLAETDRRPVLSLATTSNHPQRLLAECEAKRAIIKEAEAANQADAQLDYEVGVMVPFEPRTGDRILSALAAIYADHDDYREEWKTLTEK